MTTQSIESEQLGNAQAERLMRALVEPDPLTVALRGRIRELIETVVDAELTAVWAAAVGAARLGCSFSGANGRGITGALGPLRQGAPLSKRAISRLVGQVKALSERWHRRDLTRERDRDPVPGCHRPVRVRLDRTVVSVPGLVALGVRADGQKVVLDVKTLTSESTTAWSGFGVSRIARGLRAAVETSWPDIAVQGASSILGAT